MSRRRWPLLFIGLAFACGTSRDTVQEHRFQKRRHLPGWHLDLRTAQPAPALQTPAAARTVPSAAVLLQGPGNASEPMASTAQPLPPVPAAAPEPRIRGALHALAPAAVQQPVPLFSAQEDEQAEELPKRWNRLAIPAFVAALGAIALGFGMSLWALAGAVALTLALAAWSLVRIRRREEAGKGFALAALIIGTIAALITAISLIAYGMPS